MILRRSIILALGLMPLLTREVIFQTAIKARHVGLLSSGAPFTDTSDIVVGLKAGFSKERLLLPTYVKTARPVGIGGLRH